MINLKELLITFFYVGKSPYAPGSLTSLIIAIFWYYMPNIFYLQIILITSISILGFILCNLHYKNSSEKDPNYIVIDEVVGMAIALFMIPKVIIIFILSFFLFRLLDIFKPSIIHQSENIGHGVGIMLDDIIAGIITLLIMHFLIYGYNL